MQTHKKQIEVLDRFTLVATNTGWETKSAHPYEPVQHNAAFRCGWAGDFTLPVNKDFLEELSKRRGLAKIQMEIKFID